MKKNVDVIKLLLLTSDTGKGDVSNESDKGSSGGRNVSGSKGKA